MIVLHKTNIWEEKFQKIKGAHTHEKKLTFY
jgi:hypothetical protein